MAKRDSNPGYKKKQRRKQQQGNKGPTSIQLRATAQVPDHVFQQVRRQLRVQ